MMRKLILSSALGLLIGLSAWAAAPTNNSVVNDNIATITIDAQHTGIWDTLSSIDVTLTDTCYAIFTCTGTATLTAGQKLYAGFVCSTGTVPKPAVTTRYVPTDTLKLEWPTGAYKDRHTFGFSITYMDSLVTQTDTVKKVYAIAAVKGGTTQEEVTVTNVRMSCGISDQDDLTDTNND
ncbi:MAG: hypothetical protein U9N61_08070 [Euryarchaeota archaeon]|nr:hypothetical protein [Euryarchaeota archaeon]